MSNQVGRSGAQAEDGLSAPNRQALTALEPHLTVLMFGTNEEVGAGATWPLPSGGSPADSCIAPGWPVAAAPAWSCRAQQQAALTSAAPQAPGRRCGAGRGL